MHFLACLLRAFLPLSVHVSLPANQSDGDHCCPYGCKYNYNDTIGIGCDGAESLGEGLRRDREASVNFVRKVKEEIPGYTYQRNGVPLS